MRLKHEIDFSDQTELSHLNQLDTRKEDPNF